MTDTQTLTFEQAKDQIAIDLSQQNELEQALKDIMSHTANAVKEQQKYTGYDMHNVYAKREWAKAYTAKHKVYKILRLPDPDEYFAHK